MKKALSILITVLLLFSTVSVLMLLPATVKTSADSSVPNLIINGDAEGVMVGGNLKLKHDDADRGEGYPTNSLLGYTYYYDNGRYLYNPYGWRNNDTRYNYIELDTANAWPLNEAGRFSNFSGNNVMRLKGWTQAMQNVELEANKIYKVSVKATQRPTTATPTGDWNFDMFLDANTNTTANATRPNSVQWNLTRGHDVYTDVIEKWNSTKTFVSGGTTYYYFGDFNEYSFSFNSNDFIAANGLTPKQNGKYDARLVLLNYSAAWLLFDDVSITESIEVKAGNGGTFTGEVKTDGTETTLTAVPYYGNTFKGWYSTSGQLISENEVFSGAVTQSMIATFEQYNLIDNGDFEAPNSAETTVLYNNYPKYNTSIFGTAEILPTRIAESGPEFGNKCLSLLPSQVTAGNAANQKLKGLINIPVALEANTNYIWKFSYAFPDVKYNNQQHYLKFAVDHPQTNGRPVWTTTVDFSFHAQRPGINGIDTWEFAWGRNVNPTGGLENLGASTNDKWVDMYIIFTTQEAGTYFLTLGTAQALMDAVMIDNMSLTKAVNDTFATKVETVGNGKIYSYRTEEEAFRATELRGEKTVFDTVEEKPYFNQMYVTYYAKADRGNVFTGWYEGDTLISTEPTLTAWSTGKTYVAKFLTDETKYSVTYKVNSENGGYITSSSAENGFYRDEIISLTANTYKGNRFLGWYEGNTLVSDKADYTITVNRNVSLEARFEINNLIKDSGFENTDIATSLWGENNQWFASGDTTATYGDVVSVSAASGINSLAIRAPQTAIHHNPIAVSSGTNYHFSFDWRTPNAYADDNVSGISYLRVVDAASGAVLAESNTFLPSHGGNNWQQAFVNFNSGAATSVKFVFYYTAPASAIFLDNVTLFTTDTNEFIISADTELTDGVYGGFVSSPEEQYALIGESVTVSAVPYERNEFAGWWENGQKVSDNPVYTFTADSYRKLTAEFTCNNLTVDSSFENTDVGTNMTSAGFKNTHANGYFNVENGGGYSGNNFLSISHKDKEFTYMLKNLKEHRYYVFSFMVRSSELDYSAVMNYVQVVSERTGIDFASVENVSLSDGWQKVSLLFNTQQETALTVKFLYTSGKSVLNFDDITLYEANYVFADSAKGGSVQSTHTGAVDAGTSVTVTATPAAGNTFLGWYDYNDRTNCVSKSATYTFTVGEDVSELIAYFSDSTAEKINYFADGDFENGTGVDIRFTHPTWVNIEDDYYELVGATSSGKTPISGDKMLLIAANGHYTNLMIPNLKPQTDYTLTLSLFLENNSSFNFMSVMPYLPERGSALEQTNKGATHVKYQEFDAGIATSVASALAYVMGPEMPSGEWRDIELQFNSGRTPTVYLHILASILDVPYYIDNIRITEGTSGYSEGLVNGSFSEANDENGWLTGYAKVTEGGNTYATVSDCLKQNLKLRDTKGYTLSFRARSFEGAELLYGLTNGGTDTLTTKNAMTNVSWDRVTLTGEWQEYTLDFATANHQFTSLYFVSQNGKSFDIDDVTLTRATDTVPAEQFTFEDSEQKFSFVHQRGLAANVSNNGDWYEYSQDTAHGGSYSLMMKHKTAFVPHSLIQDWTMLSLESGRTYKFSFWVKGAAGDAFTFRVMTNDKNWEKEARVDATETLKNDGWNQYTYYFTVDYVEMTTGKLVEFSIDGVEGKSTADMYFDDFYIEESERSVVNHEASMLYTQDLSQNFFKNYSFEQLDGVVDEYITSGDAFFGKQFITVKKGDKIIVPVSTRTDISYPFHNQYTFAASILSDENAEGTVSLSFDKDGKKLLSDKNGTAANLFKNTSGDWERMGFSFEDVNEANLYLVIECSKGSFSVDYISLYNRLREYEINTHDLSDYKFDKNDPDNYVDASNIVKENLLLGTITGLPEGSKIILSGDKTYESSIDASGNYSLRNVKNGTYNMLVLGADATYATMWGDVTFLDGKASGLAITRLDGTVIKITGQGVGNGVARINDTETGYGYLTATDQDGFFTAYILDSSWAVIGTTTETDMLQTYSLKFAPNSAVKIALDAEFPASAPQFPSVILVIIMTLAAALAAASYKRKESAE